MIESGSALWNYLSEAQRELYRDGMLLIDDRSSHPNEHLSDYSYLVFPFAKLYEGFLKQLFVDLAIISPRDFKSTHFRLGKVLSPNLVRRLGKRSAYSEIRKRFGENLANTLWSTWREGRNLTFHYFPQNIRRLGLSEAIDVVRVIVATMNEAVARTHPQPIQI